LGSGGVGSDLGFYTSHLTPSARAFGFRS
jgi:hypothetical protein